jgi:hypothetical protein
MAQSAIAAPQVKETLASVRVTTHNLRQLSRRLFTRNTLAVELIQRATLYANHADSQHSEVLEMLAIADSYDEPEKAALLRQALWTAELSLSMVTAGVAMLQAAALEIAVDDVKAEAMRPKQ